MISTHTISLLQESYIDTLVKCFGLQDAHTVTTPLAPGAIFTKDQCPKTLSKIKDMAGNNYQELISSLQYVSLATHPDVTFAISKLAQFLTNTACIHLKAALCILHYLKGMKTWALNLRGDIMDVAGFMDSDWVGD
jgi:hypothetical protein